MSDATGPGLSGGTAAEAEAEDRSSSEAMRRRLEWEAAAKLTEPPESPEERLDCARGAAEAAEAFLSAWAVGDYEALSEACQRRWIEHWREKVKQEEPDPLDARLIGDGAKPGGPSWKEATGGTVAGLLTQLLGGQGRPVVFELDPEDAAVRSRVLVDVKARVVVKDRYGSRSSGKLTLRCLKETEPPDAAPDPEAGAWGVNPISVVRNFRGD